MIKNTLTLFFTETSIYNTHWIQAPWNQLDFQLIQMQSLNLFYFPTYERNENFKIILFQNLKIIYQPYINELLMIIKQIYRFKLYQSLIDSNSDK